MRFVESRVPCLSCNSSEFLVLDGGFACPRIHTVLVWYLSSTALYVPYLYILAVGSALSGAAITVGTITTYRMYVGDGIHSGTHVDISTRYMYSSTYCCKYPAAVRMLASEQRTRSTLLVHNPHRQLQYLRSLTFDTDVTRKKAA